MIVKLPNGHTVIATLAGKIQITQFLYLEVVLYISSFQYNLISVSKLVSSLPCNLPFMNDKRFIQDMNQQKISTVEMMEGLCRLKMIPFKSRHKSGFISSSISNFLPFHVI